MSFTQKFLGVVVAAVLAMTGLALATTDTNKRLFDREMLQIQTGTATVNSATADYSSWQGFITITPDNGHALLDCKVVLDLAKASTGFSAVYSSGTIQATVARKVDGTNWRGATNLATTAISGTNAAGLSLELTPGLCSPGESVRINIKISTVSNTNVDIPFVVYSRTGVRCVVTPAS